MNQEDKELLKMDAREKILAASQLMERQDWEGALEVIYQGIQADRRNYELYFMLAQCKEMLDRLYVCANHDLAEEAVGLFREKLGLSQRQCSSYVKSYIGPRSIDWDGVETEEDIIERIVRSGTMNDLERFAIAIPTDCCLNGSIIMKYTIGIFLNIGMSRLSLWKSGFTKAVP